MNVVIEYKAKADVLPGVLQGIGVECMVAHNGSGLQLSGDLEDVRWALDEAGFERKDQVDHVGRTHSGGRWSPTWREVWTREPVAAGNPLALSPRAQKAQREAASRAMDWQATVARTQAKAVVMRPQAGSRQQMRQFAEWVKANLAAFSYDSQKGYWKAPLEELRVAVEVLERANLSDGARQYLGMV